MSAEPFTVTVTGTGDLDVVAYETAEWLGEMAAQGVEVPLRVEVKYGSSSNLQVRVVERKPPKTPGRAEETYRAMEAEEGESVAKRAVRRVARSKKGLGNA